MIRTRADDFFSSFTHLEKRLRTIGCTNPLTGREGEATTKFYQDRLVHTQINNDRFFLIG